jgi:hypothetical protein
VKNLRDKHRNIWETYHTDELVSDTVLLHAFASKWSVWTHINIIIIIIIINCNWVSTRWQCSIYIGFIETHGRRYPYSSMEYLQHTEHHSD